MKKKKVKRIKSVDVGGVTYKIVYSSRFKNKNLVGPEDSIYYGCVLPCKNIIVVDSNTSPDMVPFILFHELTHCAMEQTGMSIEAQDEKYVRPLTHMLYNALRQVKLIK